MTDILRALSVDVHCDRCGDFSIGADVIAESQRLLAEGCPGSPHECPPQLFARLLPQTALESLQRAWNALETAAYSPVRQIALDDAPHVATRVSDELDSRTIARWEDDGGYVPRKTRGA